MGGVVRSAVVLAVATIFACEGPPSSAPDAGPNPALCGNGVVDPGEACDTAIPMGAPGACPTNCPPAPACVTNQLSGAGSCQARCETQTLSNCCGNGMLEQGEACDDGNVADFDGCSSDCRLERALIMHTVALLPRDQGCDLDGDGRIDNAFGGAVNTLAAEYFSNWYSGKLASCSFRSIWIMRGADAAMQGPWTLSLEIGQDATPTPSTGDVFSGSEPFVVLERYIDPAGIRLLGQAPGGALAAGPATLIMQQPLPYCWTTPVLDVLPQKISHMSIAGTLTDDANGPASFGGYVFTPTQPDVDVDGDGFERVMDTDGDGQVDLCLDGDGTQISGLDCPLDPRMADAYSEALHVTAVGARLAGSMP